MQISKPYDGSRPLVDLDKPHSACTEAGATQIQLLTISVHASIYQTVMTRPCFSLDSMDFSASTDALLPTRSLLARSFL